MTNHEAVMNAFDQLGGSGNHIQALIAAVRGAGPLADELARQLIQLAIADGLLTIDATGQVRKV